MSESSSTKTGRIDKPQWMMDCCFSLIVGNKDVLENKLEMDAIDIEIILDYLAQECEKLIE